MQQNITILDANLVLFPRNADGTTGAGIETGEGTIQSAAVELTVETKTFTNRSGDILQQIIKRPSGRLTAVSANLSAENIARALNGDIIKESAGTAVKTITGIVPGGTYALDHMKVGDVAVRISGTTTNVPSSDYTVNEAHGRITFADTVTAENVDIAYDYDAHFAVGFFTKVAAEFTSRFEGTELAEGAPCVTELYRCKFDPSKNLPLVSDDFATLELQAQLLADLKKPVDAVLGRYGRYLSLK